MPKKPMYNTTKALILDVAVPKTTNTYKPVSNQQLIDLTLDGILKGGFTLDKELYSASKKGNQVNARFTIKSVQDDEMQLMIGWQNSYDKTLSFKFAIGSQIFICSNGCVSGNIGSIKKKHKGNIQEFAPERIAEYIKFAADNFKQLQLDRDRMKNVEITKRTSAELLGRMFLDEEIITATQLGIVKRELEHPTHDYKCKNSAWELYNFTTFALKGEAPSEYIDTHSNVHEFFMNKSGILVPEFLQEYIEKGEDTVDEIIHEEKQEELNDVFLQNNDSGVEDVQFEEVSTLEDAQAFGQIFREEEIAKDY